MLELEKPEGKTMSFRQRIFVRYIMAILIDLVVLNLLDEYWDAVVIDSFTISILAAFILQILLRATMVFEHKVASYFKSKPGKINVFLRWFTAWLILFGSKFLILFVIDVIFGERVEFRNVIVFIAVVVAVVLAEVAITALYNLKWMKNTRKPQHKLD
jgi:hypothetical protein